MRAALILAGAFAFVGCAADGDDSSPVNDGEDDITGGSVERGSPAVGLIIYDRARADFCSGTLVTPTVVLTAAHCVNKHPGTPEGFFTGVGEPRGWESGPRLATGMTRHTVIDAASYGRYACGADVPDIALYRLAEPVRELAVMNLARVAPRVGVRCTSVGFGDNVIAPNLTFGQKRSTSVSVIEVSGAYLQVEGIDGIPAAGDSGGPLLCGGVVVGATSCTHDQGEWPTRRREIFGRVDATRSWIDQTIAAWAAR